MNFSTEEITLCKEIAKYYRKPIKKGDRYLIPALGQDIYLWTFPTPNTRKETIPLFTWQDARNWLRENNFILRNLSETVDGISIFSGILNRKPIRAFQEMGKTDTEAILKVMVQILKED
jgi:hypothetical protein